MADRSKDWIEQAERDLASARSQIAAGFHEWACFISQQAAKKAVKAVLQRWGAEAWGHSVTQLLAALSERSNAPPETTDAARTLDRYYIPSRYPNGYAEGKPSDYLNREDWDRATVGAEAIIRFCNGLLGR